METISNRFGSPHVRRFIALGTAGVPDQLQLARLKKKKLPLRDEIAWFEDQLVPDIIA